MNKKRIRQNNLVGKQCYACTEQATSWEHAPPRGFYPRTRDLPAEISGGRDYRRGLIEVPACEAHNSAKSQDDNFVQAAVGIFAAAYSGRLTPGDSHPFVSQLIARIRTHPRLRAALIESAEFVTTPFGDVVKIKPEAATIRRIVELTARALYYHEHEHKQRWPGTCDVQSPHFRLDDLSLPAGAQDIRDMIARFTHLHKINYQGFAMKGPHLDVFAYQLLEVDDAAVAMRMTFYGVFHFLAFSRVS